MRFAILGTHPDGLETACALVESGRHRLLAYTVAPPDATLRRWGPSARLVADLEEILADPAVEAVLVAGGPAERPAQLRRAMQSERHVLCVHPADATPDAAYEAAMIQRDTGRVLLPLLSEGLHPGVVRLAELLRQPDGPLGPPRLVEVERWSPDAVLLPGEAARRPGLPGWDVLRRLGGEVAEVTGYAEREEVSPDEPLALSGRFERGGMFRASFLPRQPESRWRLTVSAGGGRAELVFPLGWGGPAFLRWAAAGGERREEAWGVWDPWQALAAAFEAAVAGSTPPLTWQDEVRCLELDDAVRRSVERRRATPLEYPDATEEVGIKGTMTLLGCGLLWVVLLLLVLSMWLPWAGWLIAPVIVAFLALQVFLWAVRRPA